MKLEDRLPNALDSLANTPPLAEPGEFDPHRPTQSLATMPTGGSRRSLVAAAAITVIGVGGLVVATSRSNPAPVADSVPLPETPSVTLPPASEAPGPDGALLPAPPANLQPISIEHGPIPSLESIAWYATSAPRPEADTHLRVRMVGLGLAPETVAQCISNLPMATVSLADGTTVCLEERDAPTDPTGTIERKVGEYVVIVDGNATDDQLMAAAANLIAGPTPGSFEIEPAGLPDGVDLLATGASISDFADIETADANDDDMIYANYLDEEARSIFYLATRSDPASLGIDRIGFDSISDTTVRGQPGFIRTLDNQPSYVGIVWHESGFTYRLGSQGFTQAELLDIVDDLVVPSQSEWDAALASIPSTEQMEERAPVTTIIVDQ